MIYWGKQIFWLKGSCDRSCTLKNNCTGSSTSKKACTAEWTHHFLPKKPNCHSCWAEVQYCRTGIMQGNYYSSGRNPIPVSGESVTPKERLQGKFAEDVVGPSHKAFQKVSLLRAVSMCHACFSNAHHVAPGGKEKEWHQQSTNRVKILHSTERIDLRCWIFWCNIFKTSHDSERMQNSLWLCLVSLLLPSHIPLDPEVLKPSSVFGKKDFLHLIRRWEWE